MRVKRWLLAGIALCLLTGMRDPFKPPEDLCRISELSQWRYQGMVGRGERIIGVIKDGQKKWRGRWKLRERGRKADAGGVEVGVQQCPADGQFRKRTGS